MPTEARKVLLPFFVLTETCQQHEAGALKREMPPQLGGSSVDYFYRPIVPPALGRREQPPRAYNLMPVVLDGKSAPWNEANLYIIAKLETTTAPDMVTYHGIADDLAAFKRFLEDEELDYKVFPREKLHRPTYRYKGRLTQMIQASEIAVSTAQRRMSRVVGFYRWLASERMVVFANPPWIEKDSLIHYTDAHGFTVVQKVKRTDVAIRTPQQIDPYAETIDDGGHLRPLPPDEQQIVVKALLNLGNTEMTLIHFVALFTGARIQTVLSLQVRHVRSTVPDDLKEIRLPVGPGTGVDTKNNKRFSLFLPRWLYEKLRTYSYSRRADLRRLRAGDESDLQYLFLTNRGAPFYDSKADRSRFNNSHSQRHLNNGQGVRQFIADHMLPEIKKQNSDDFKYKLHDLRASYGMNLTDQQLAMVQKNEITLHQAREFVKSRMAHNKLATTDLYLNYRQNLKIIRAVQASYEDHLNSLADKAQSINI